MVAIAVERKKTKKEWILYGILAPIIALNLANGAMNYLNNEATFQDQRVSWLPVWGQSGLLLTYFFLPIVIGVKAAMVVRVENENANWRRMASYNAAVGPVYRGKLAAIAGFCAACQLLYLALFMATGLLLGFTPDAAHLGPYLFWSFCGWVGSCTVGVVQLYAALRIASFASTVTVGAVGSIAGFALTLAVPPLGALFPYTQIGAGMRARALEPFTLPEAVLYLVFNLVLIAGFALAGARYVKRREY